MQVSISMTKPEKISTPEIPAALARLLAEAQRLVVLTGCRHGPVVPPNRGRVVEINPDPTPLMSLCDVALSGKAGEVLPALLTSLEDVKRGLTG